MPYFSEAENKGIEVKVVGGGVVNSTFMQQRRVSIPSQTCITIQVFMNCFHNLSHVLVS